MSNPALPNLSDPTAVALSDVVDPKTGIRHIQRGANSASSPPLFTRHTQLHEYVFELLSRFGGGCVHLGGLNVGVYAVEYKIGATDKSFAGVATQALTPSATNYLYLDNDQTLKISTSAWPGGDHFRIAKVTTNGSTVTSLVEERMRNFMIGIVNAWYSVAAGADVDLNGKALKSVGELWPSASTELTLASDTITPTRMSHSVDTQADAASDDLVTITADAAKIGRLLIVRCENAARVVTVKSTGNIKLKQGNLVLNDVEKFVLLQQHNATQWTELLHNFMSFGPLTQNINMADFDITNVGFLGLHTDLGVQLSSDTLTPIRTVTPVQAESGFSDTLDLVDYAPVSSDAPFLILTATSGMTITIRDAALSSGNIFLNKPNSTVAMTDADYMLFMHSNAVGGWVEIARSQRTLSELVGTGQVIPYAIGPCHYPGTPSLNQQTWNYPVLQPFKFRRARGNVGTAPSGGSCVVHVMKNGASVFAADANAINIAVGTLEDTSDTVDVDFAPGDVMSVKVTTVNAAANLTVAFDTWIEAIASA